MDINNYQNQLNIVNEWSKAADQKISILIAIIVGSVGLFSEQLVSLFVYITHQGEIPIAIIFSIWITTLGWMIVKLIFALTPSTKNDGNSILYFGHIAAMSTETFSKKVAKLSKEKYEQALVEQIHTNSKIAVRKHRFLAESVRLLLVNVALLVSI